MSNPTEEQIWEVLEAVADPEIPVLTVRDLGIVRSVHADEQGVEVVITPTYSGCPAMNMIEFNIKAALRLHGFGEAKVTTVLSPAWTTDWMTEEGKTKLKAYGIAPPVGSVDKSTLLEARKVVQCPNCGSYHTELISQFGSTACKALYRCVECREPFDYFKCH